MRRTPSKPAPKSNRRKAPRNEPFLYLGCFFFDHPGDDSGWTGTFQVIVEATSPERALEAFKARLRKLRASTTLFNEPTTIFIEGFIKLAGSFKDGLLVNYASRQRKTDAELGCLIPEQKNYESIGYEWIPPGKERGKRSSRDKSEGETMEPFIDFGGERVRKATVPARDATLAGSTPTEMNMAADAAREAAAKAARAAREAAGKKKAEAELAAKKRRRDALKSTLEELRSKNRTRTKTPITPKND